MAGGRTMKHLVNDSVKNGGTTTMTVSRWTVTTCLVSCFVRHCFNTAPDGVRRCREILVPTSCWHPSIMALFMFDLPHSGVIIGRQHWLYVTKEDSVSVPRCIIIITNESIGSDRIRTFSPTGTVYRVLYRMHLLGRRRSIHPSSGGRSKYFGAAQQIRAQTNQSTYGFATLSHNTTRYILLCYNTRTYITTTVLYCTVGPSWLWQYRTIMWCRRDMVLTS